MIDRRKCIQMIAILRFDFCDIDLECWRKLRSVLAAMIHRKQIGLTLVIEPGP